MNRRDFVAGSVAIAAASGLTDAQAADRPEGGREHYDLRLLTFATRAALERYALFLKEALFPAVRRLGGESAGAFTVADKPDELSLYLLLSYPSLSAYGTGESRLMADAEFRKAGAAVLDLPATDPPYTYAESSLLLAFESWPNLKIPKEAAGDQPRVFELRTYESHSRKANLKKIEMFNQGEPALFARHGFQPVFFGETLAGPQIPNLTYMLTYPTIEARGEFWKAWGADPEKDRLFANPDYADRLIVSKIHQTFLKPLPGSII
jgi:hypothetical protein